MCAKKIEKVRVRENVYERESESVSDARLI